MKQPRASGSRLPEINRSRSLRGLVYFREHNGKPIAQTWPKKRGKPSSPVTQQQNQLFAETVRAVRDVDPQQRINAEEIAKGTAYVWRDVLFMAMHGDWIEIEGLAEMAITGQLDTITDTPGAMLARGDVTWIGLEPPSDNAVLAFDIITHFPFWTTPDAIAITELFGDVIAGPGVGPQEATLSETGVDPGTYDFATITVDAKGRITAAETGTPEGGITELGGDVIAGPGSGIQTAELSETGVVAGSYGHASITVDVKGRIIDADVGAVATTSVAGTVRPDGTTITVDADGIITATTGTPGTGGGLFGQVLGPTPTIASTGFSTWINQGSAAVADIATGMRITCPAGAGANYHGREKAEPATPYTAWFLLANMAEGGNFASIGVGIRNSGGRLLLGIMAHVSGWIFTADQLNSPTSWNSNPPLTKTQKITGNPAYLYVENDNTNRVLGYSYDGVTKKEIAIVPIASGWIPTTGTNTLCLGVNCDGFAASLTLMDYRLA